MDNDRRLITICEGNAHTIEYLHKNGVYPGTVVFSPSKFKEMIPYLSSSDDILVIIKGLTDFSLASVYALIEVLVNAESRLYDITILSNVDLGVTALPYYFYEGDLFYGAYRKVKGGKYSNYIVETATDESETSKNGKKSKLAKNTTQTAVINPVIARYKLYKRSNNKLVIYGSEPPSEGVTNDTGDEFLRDKIVFVDAFSDK